MNDLLKQLSNLLLTISSDNTSNSRKYFRTGMEVKKGRLIKKNKNKYAIN